MKLRQTTHGQDQAIRDAKIQVDQMRAESKSERVAELADIFDRFEFDEIIGIVENLDVRMTRLIEEREEDPTDAAIDLACVSYRHDFWVIPTVEQNDLRRQAADWHRAWNREE